MMRRFDQMPQDLGNLPLGPAYEPKQPVFADRFTANTELVIPESIRKQPEQAWSAGCNAAMVPAEVYNSLPETNTVWHAAPVDGWRDGPTQANCFKVRQVPDGMGGIKQQWKPIPSAEIPADILQTLDPPPVMVPRGHWIAKCEQNDALVERVYSLEAALAASGERLRVVEGLIVAHTVADKAVADAMNGDAAALQEVETLVDRVIHAFDALKAEGRRIIAARTGEQQE